MIIQLMQNPQFLARMEIIQKILIQSMMNMNKVQKK